MIKEKDYLKAKKIVQEYENEQLNKFATNTRKYTDEINLERDDIYIQLKNGGTKLRTDGLAASTVMVTG